MSDIEELLTANAEVRAAIRIAGRHIKELNFGRKEHPVLKLLRRALKEARTTVKRVEQQSKTAVQSQS